MDTKVLILDSTQITQKINRLAYQVYEQNFEESQIIIYGIPERGFELASRIADKLQEISHFNVRLESLNIDKSNPEKINPLPESYKNEVVILCDDVLYTGKTMAYSAIPFIEGGVKKLQCLVLIHRHHLTYPIQPTFIGLSLATTLQEHVNVSFQEPAKVELG